MDAFDADVLIYAASPDHPLGRAVRTLLWPTDDRDEGTTVGVGSVLLIPEMLSKPIREGSHDEASMLAAVLGRLELLAVDHETALLAAALGVRYRLHAADAVHLATAVRAGAERFITNNSKDFGTRITEIEVLTPSSL